MGGSQPKRCNRYDEVKAEIETRVCKIVAPCHYIYKDSTGSIHCRGRLWSAACTPPINFVGNGVPILQFMKNI